MKNIIKLLIAVILLILAIRLMIPKETVTYEYVHTKQNEQISMALSPREPQYMNIQYAYTEEELELMALIIYQEHGADSSSDTSRIMVGNVVLNRVKSDRFPNTILEVITQKGQYHQDNGPKWPKRASKDIEQHAVKRAYECARRVLEGERLLPDNVLWQANFRQGSGVYEYRDNTYFCY